MRKCPTKNQRKNQSIREIQKMEEKRENKWKIEEIRYTSA